MVNGNSGSGDPDMGLVGELLEEISRNPPAIAARKLLVEHYMTVGWLEAATENANELSLLSPGDPEVAGFLGILQKKPEPPEPVRPSTAPKPVVKASKSKTAFRFSHTVKRTTKPSGRETANLEKEREDFAENYASLRSRAQHLVGDLLHLKALQKKNGLPPSGNIGKIEAIANGGTSSGGGNSSYSVTSSSPQSARAVARTIQASPDDALKLTIVDLEGTMNWLRESPGKTHPIDDDLVREALVKRMQALEAALPEQLKHCPEVALMHISHEHLGKTYVNDETMLGDQIKDIPRENFWVTEDNYAWDMDELAQAITANGGVMRNPLSKQLFTPKDIQGILAHEQGKGLRSLQVEQHEMAKGVRPETIDQMEKLAKILLDDQSSEQLPSRTAVDEFLAYVATLPELEQKALDGLKCPAKDSHTHQAYDFSIGEAVRDAKGNRVCFHKTGDFIKQAAAHLRENRGAPPEPPQENGSCVVM